MSKDKRYNSCLSQHQNRAVSALLDCSDTKKLNKKQKIQQFESICPWTNLTSKPLVERTNNSLLIKPNRAAFNRTYTRYKPKPNRQVFSKTILSTKKTKCVLEQIQNYHYMSSNVINLNKELELIHHKKKNTYVNNYIRQQLYLRLKTN